MGLRKLKLLNQFVCMIAMSVALQGVYALERVDNFMLLDHMGDAHELYYHRNASAIVMMVQGNGCPIVRNAIGEFKELRDKYADQGAQFFMVNSLSLIHISEPTRPY